jgi:hypothetical protein
MYSYVSLYFKGLYYSFSCKVDVQPFDNILSRWQGGGNATFPPLSFNPAKNKEAKHTNQHGPQCLSTSSHSTRDIIPFHQRKSNALSRFA